MLAVVRRVMCVAAVFMTFMLAVPADAAGAKIAYAKKTVNIAARSSRSATVTCPTGTQITGGGVSAPPPLMLRETAPGANAVTSWRGKAINPSRKPHYMTVFAACARVANLPAGTSFETTPSSPASAGVGATTFAARDCDGSGRFVTGGGIRVDSNDPAVRIVSSRPGDFTGPNTHAWNGAVVNNSLSTTTFQVTTVCIDPTVSMSYPTASVNAAPNANATTSVACSFGQPSGGGAEIASTDPAPQIRSSRPTGLGAKPPGTGWSTTGNAGNATGTLSVFAACMGL